MPKSSRNIYPKRGEIWIADLIPGKGWEIAKKRPVIVISADEINANSPLAIIIPISTQISQIIGPERIFLQKEKGVLEKDSVAVTNQIRAIDKSRFIKKIGKISLEKLVEIEDSLKLVLGMTPLDK